MKRQLRCAIGFERHQSGLWVPTWERAPASASGLLVPRQLADELAAEHDRTRGRMYTTTVDPDGVARMREVTPGFEPPSGVVWIVHLPASLPHLPSLPHVPLDECDA